MSYPNELSQITLSLSSFHLTSVKIRNSPLLCTTLSSQESYHESDKTKQYFTATTQLVYEPSYSTLLFSPPIQTLTQSTCSRLQDCSH